MRDLIDLTALHQPLMDAGLVPPHCKTMWLSIGLTGALTVHYEVFLDAEDLVKLGAVFQQVGHAALGKDDA